MKDLDHQVGIDDLSDVCKGVRPALTGVARKLPLMILDFRLTRKEKDKGNGTGNGKGTVNGIGICIGSGNGIDACYGSYAPNISEAPHSVSGAVTVSTHATVAMHLIFLKLPTLYRER